MLPPGGTGFLYGLGLGVGFATHLGHGTLVAVAAAVVAGGDPVAGAAALGAFGVARSVAVAVTWTARDPDGARMLGRRLERAAIGSIPRLANGLALAAIGIAAVWAGPSTAPGGSAVVPALILAGTFGWSAAAKALRPATWRAALAAHDLPRPANSAALVAVPVTEGAVPVLVLSGSTRMGAIIALALLYLFSAALVRLRSRLGDRVPCGCFGTSRTRSVRLLIARNLALGIVAAAAAAGPDRIQGLRAPMADEWLPAVLAAGGTMLAAVMMRRTVALLRRARPSTGAR
jgi:hypothetical protein